MGNKSILPTTTGSYFLFRIRSVRPNLYSKYYLISFSNIFSLYICTCILLNVSGIADLLN